MKYKFWLIIFIISIARCNIKTNDQVEKNTDLDDITNNDSILSKHDNSYRGNDLKKIVSELDLENIDEGFDSIFLRIFYPELSKRYIVEIKKTKANWQANLIKLEYEYDNRLEKYVLVSKINKQIIPKSGWINFTEKLFKLAILKLPDSDKISGYRDGIDGCTFSIEYARSNEYRNFQYWEPELNKKEHWQAQKLIETLDLIENEFDFKRVKCD